MEYNEGDTREVQKPEGLNNRAVIIAVALFGLIVLGMFGYAYLASSPEEAATPAPTQQDDGQTEEGPYSHIERINGIHFYNDDVHTIVGEIAMPTPCDLLNTDATVAESFPEQVTLEFEVINNAETCAQVVTPARFRISVEASEEATFSGRFNGRPVELNLRPAAPGESLDDFEVFQKG